jgi:nucleoid DNA-binding protein
MNKKEMVQAVCERLRRDEVRKQISVPKHMFHITDDEGNRCDFQVRQVGKSVLFNQNDVTAIVDTCLAVVEEALQRGEAVNLHGIGVLEPYLRAARSTKAPGTENWVHIAEHYVPKFTAGTRLRTAVKIYDLTKNGGEAS